MTESRCWGDGGSVLLLVPAGVLVVLTLAALAVDTTIAFLAERELHAAASAAANDAVTYGLDEEAYRETGEWQLDPARVERAVRFALEARQPDELLANATFDVTIEAPDTVRVTVFADAPTVFARAIPGADDHIAVSASAAATAILDATE